MRFEPKWQPSSTAGSGGTSPEQTIGLNGHSPGSEPFNRKLGQTGSQASGSQQQPGGTPAVRFFSIGDRGLCGTSVDRMLQLVDCKIDMGADMRGRLGSIQERER